MLDRLAGVPRRSAAYGLPCEWVVDGEWPDATFRADTPDVVAYAAELSRRLGQALAGKSKTDVAARSNLTRPTLYDILQGKSWPDMISIARLETALEVDLWPASPPPLRRSASQ